MDRIAHWWRSQGDGTRWLLGAWILVSLTGWLAGGTPLSLVTWLQLEDGCLRKLQFWRLPGHALGTTDLMNVVFGGFFLAWLGTGIEASWNRGWFITYYLACATGTGLAMVLLTRDGAAAFSGNAGALLGLLVAWHNQQRGRTFALFGGPEVSATVAASITALCFLLPAFAAGSFRLPLALIAGGATGWLLMRANSGIAGRRATKAAAQPRMSRLEL